MKMHWQKKEGNLMIESMVAISVILISMLGIFSLLSQTIGINKDVGQKFVATYLAAEGIEVIRSLIDANYVAIQAGNTTIAWNQGLGNGDYQVSYDSTVLGQGTSPLSFDPATGIYSYTGAEATPFMRTVSITNFSNGYEMKVVSMVNWSDRGVAKSVSLEDHFFNWRRTQ